MRAIAAPPQIRTLLRGLGADGEDFVPAVTRDGDRNVANDNADDAWDAYRVSAKPTFLS
jgi:hypothetical protein